MKFLLSRDKILEEIDATLCSLLTPGFAYIWWYVLTLSSLASCPSVPSIKFESAVGVFFEIVYDM